VLLLQTIHLCSSTLVVYLRSSKSVAKVLSIDQIISIIKVGKSDKPKEELTQEEKEVAWMVEDDEEITEEEEEDEQEIELVVSRFC